jgi:cold shock CspA family protein
MRGTVTEFDEHKGYGVITADNAPYFFHCTQIADGSRTIDVDETVEFEMKPWHRGQCQAVAISPIR